jgi:hypothetical protein
MRTYHRVLATSLGRTPPTVWRFCCDQGLQELRIRKFKGFRAKNKIPSRNFWANALYLEAILRIYA